jgi:hypothetical protein
MERFRDFWPLYLREHRDPRSRALHYCGTTAAVLMVAAACARRQPLLLLVAAVVGYGPAWAGHFLIEKNRPATFRHPLWSLAGDFKMLAMALTGRLAPELRALDGARAPRA